MWPFSGTKYPAIYLEQAKQEPKTYDYIIVGGPSWSPYHFVELTRGVQVERPDVVSQRVSPRIPPWPCFFLSTGTCMTPDVERSDEQDHTHCPITLRTHRGGTVAEGQVVDVVHAQTLGGGSAVNVILVTRGVPYFIKSEKSLSYTSGIVASRVGPLVNQSFPDFPYKVQHKGAAIAMGFTNVQDLSSSTVPVNVCATVDAAIDGSMRRVSTYHAFLPAQLAPRPTRRSQGNVAVRVVFEPTDGNKVQTFYARARKEVAVCCGALGSPQLLLLSGFGRKEDLKEFGIEPVADLPGVGAHLDHAGLPLMYEVPLEDTLHHLEN
ncbi:hypothetical protein DFH08DRAFT_1071959 [Mycena albidolilacea]|uniref:Glucose-methanol-choline oxidoreductase N-terminal domain-containing protein n=1 Tax=Mycena albidolilacea TaxID=1033008 RepID=A0AAD7F4Z7_9AGAR|nr:hypothetical protein DFH08DRAFT_1071959 [Mycena albidolilacea]